MGPERATAAHHYNNFLKCRIQQIQALVEKSATCHHLSVSTKLQEQFINIWKLVLLQNHCKTSQLGLVTLGIASSEKGFEAKFSL